MAPSRISDGSGLHIKDLTGLLRLGPFLLLLTKKECPLPFFLPDKLTLAKAKHKPGQHLAIPSILVSEPERSEKGMWVCCVFPQGKQSRPRYR